MRKMLTSLALGCAFAAALSVAASACDYGKQADASSSTQAAKAADAPAGSATN